LWAHNGREIFYREVSSGAMMVAAYVTNPVFRVDSREVLFDATPYRTTTGWHIYDLTGDDQRFAMIRQAPPDVGSARLVQVRNWFTELRERTGG
jgi:hypothetical protein